MSTEAATQTIKVTTDEVLAQFIQKLIAGMDATVDFASEQIPDVIHQLLVWKAAESFIQWFAAVIISCLWIRKFLHDTKNVPEDCTGWNTVYDGDQLGPQIMLHMILILPLSVVWCQLDWLQILLAPKLYLLEYASQLVK